MNYTIVPGDTLTRIARRFNTSVTALLTANDQLDANNPDYIRAGDTLIVPDNPSSAPVTVDQAGQIMQLPTMAIHGDQPPASLAFNLADWLKPPKLYYALGVLALGAYLFTKKERR